MTTLRKVRKVAAIFVVAICQSECQKARSLLLKVEFWRQILAFQLPRQPFFSFGLSCVFSLFSFSRSDPNIVELLFCLLLCLCYEPCPRVRSQPTWSHLSQYFVSKCLHLLAVSFLRIEPVHVLFVLLVRRTWTSLVYVATFPPLPHHPRKSVLSQ